jgi:hypothetical protein
LANHLTSQAASDRSKQEFADRAKHERTEKILAKGEELVGLLCGVSEWHTQAIDDVLTPEYSKMIFWPTQPDRVEALVLAYFPQLGQELHALRLACIQTNQAVIEMRKAQTAHESYKPAHAALLKSATELQQGVLKSMRST